MVKEVTYGSNSSNKPANGRWADAERYHHDQHAVQRRGHAQYGGYVESNCDSVVGYELLVLVRDAAAMHGSADNAYQ